METKWISARTPQSGVELLCIATFLPVRRWRDVVPFLWLSARIDRQLRKSPGLVRHSLKADLPRRHFWTLSVWDDRASVDAFVAAEPHATAVMEFARWAGEGAAFAEWKASNPDLGWARVLEELKKPRFYYQGSSCQE